MFYKYPKKQLTSKRLTKRNLLIASEKSRSLRSCRAETIWNEDRIRVMLKKIVNIINIVVVNYQLIPRFFHTF